MQAEKHEQQSMRSIAQGVTNADACRLVGINGKDREPVAYGRRVRNSAGELIAIDMLFAEVVWRLLES